MSLAALMREPLPVTAPLVLNPLMAKIAEATRIDLEKLLAVERATVEKTRTT